METFFNSFAVQHLHSYSGRSIFTASYNALLVFFVTECNMGSNAEGVGMLLVGWY